MSLKVVGYQDGKRIVIDEGPAYGGSSRLGGSLVQGASGTPSRIRIHRDRTEQRKAYRERMKARKGVA